MFIYAVSAAVKSGGKEEIIGVLAKVKRRVTLQNINLRNYWTG